MDRWIRISGNLNLEITFIIIYIFLFALSTVTTFQYIIGPRPGSFTCQILIWQLLLKIIHLQSFVIASSLVGNKRGR